MLEYLPKRLQTESRRKIQRAYDKGDYKKAKAALNRIRAELSLINESAVKSLD